MCRRTGEWVGGCVSQPVGRCVIPCSRHNVRSNAQLTPIKVTEVTASVNTFHCMPSVFWKDNPPLCV